jgi:hypothetical protein
MRKRIAALAGGGLVAVLLTALAVTVAFAQTPTPTNPGAQAAQSYLARVARILGIDQARLDAAAKQASLEIVDEQLQAGRLTPEQAQRARDRINQGSYGFPLGGRGGPGGPDRGVRGGVTLADAATVLGLTEDQLRTELQAGRTLAQIAQSRNISRDVLIQRLTDAANQRIDAAVAAGRLTAAQAAERKAGTRDRVTAAVDAPGLGKGAPRAPGTN